MGDFEALTHAVPKQQLLSPPPILVFCGPHHSSLSPSPGWGSQRVGTGWSTSRVEWGKSLGVVRPALPFSWLCLWYAGADLSREKGRSVVKATTPLSWGPWALIQ